MSTFLILQTRLMRAINRPISETNVLSGAKEAINDVILELQRDHAFAYTEGLATLTYAASSLFVDIGTICGGLLRDVMSLQEIAPGGSYEGKPLKIVSYNQLQADRGAHERTHSIDSTDIYAEALVGLTIEDSFRSDKVAFLVGKNIGIYPRPTVATTFLLNCHVWLPALSSDSDTNFFLIYAQDVVYMKALKKLQIYMKNTSDFPYTNEEIKEAVLSLNIWDSQLKETPITRIQ